MAALRRFSRQGLSYLNQVRSFHRSIPSLGALDADFEAAKKRLNSLKEDPGNQVKLQIYALFKQATTGPCNTKKPGMMDFVGKAKWDAWNSMGQTSKDDAMRKYIDLTEKLAAHEPKETPQDATGALHCLEVSVADGVGKIILNRPHKKNAFSRQMYNEWKDTLTAMAKDDRVVVATVTGSGDMYSSGNDLENFADANPNDRDDLARLATDGGELLQGFVESFIDFPKPLVALVNGPAVGVAVTTLALCDIVYASDKATFHTPFSALGQSPEACSSYTFPKIMGQARANEMLLMNKKMTAQEAVTNGFIAAAYPDATFREETEKLMKIYAGFPKESLTLSKQLIRSIDIDLLKKVNKAECDRLVERWQSNECFEAVMNFLSK